MKGLRALGALAVLLIMGAIGVIITSFFVSNNLFTTSDLTAPAAASAAVLLMGVLVFIGIGRPWKGWKRTAYW